MKNASRVTVVRKPGLVGLVHTERLEREMIENADGGAEHTGCPLGREFSHTDLCTSFGVPDKFTPALTIAEAGQNCTEVVARQDVGGEILPPRVMFCFVPTQ